MPEGAPQGEVIALEFDAANGRILQAWPNAIHESRDGGVAWNPIPLPPSAADARISDVAVSESGDRLYVAVGGVGMLRSDDAGRTWQRLGADLPDRSVSALATHADQEETLYAYVDGEETGVYRSEDAGASWTRMDVGPGPPVRRFIHSPMDGSMQTGWLFAATAEGVGRSMDCFCGWRETGALEAEPVHDVAFDPAEPRRVYAAAGGGLFRSDDGGENWERIAGAPAATAIAVSQSGVVYAALLDGSFARSTDDGQTWELTGA